MQTIPNLQVLKDNLDQQNIVFKALVFSGDQLVDVIIFDSIYVDKTLSELEMNKMFSTFLKKYFSNTGIDNLDNLVFDKDLTTNMEKTIYSQEISGYLKSGSKDLERFKHIEYPYINLVLEQFYNY